MSSKYCSAFNKVKVCCCVPQLHSHTQILFCTTSSALLLLNFMKQSVTFNDHAINPRKSLRCASRKYYFAFHEVQALFYSTVS